MLSVLENNLALQEPLYQLRSDTKDAFDEAKRLEARLKELDREQRDLYQVRLLRLDRRTWSLPPYDVSDLAPSFCSCA